MNCFYLAVVSAPQSYRLLPPVVEQASAKVLIIVAAYAITLAFSGRIVRYFILPRGGKSPAPENGRRFDSSTIIGKCENIITVTFMLLGQETGLALIFAGKSIVRSDDIKKDPGYFLGGTLINLVWSLLMAGVARVLVAGI